jgi:type II secretory pathway pseudopilin PulG
MELLVVVGLMGLLTLAISSAFVAGLDLERLQAERRATQTQDFALEQRLTRLLRGIKLAEDETDLNTYFVGETLTGSGELGCDQITFTTTSPGVSLAAIASTDDFETQHTQRGAIGGVAEVSLGLTPVGDGGSESGLFERLQRPSDGDYSQGGTETVLDPEIDQIGFQFWNGTEWITEWDTINGAERRLPQAIRVSYTRTNANSENPVRSFVVPIPTSDVTADNPATGTTGGTL